jgi:hypothetical protein
MQLLVLLISTHVLGSTPDGGEDVSVAPGGQLSLEIWGDGSVMRVSGNGVLTPFLDSQDLELGQSYTLRAIPGPGIVFAGWSGDRQGAEETLSFVLQPNMFLRAIFIPNPFIAAAGAYNGLFYEAPSLRHGSSGQVTLSLTEQGSFTAKLQAGGGRHSFVGRFALDGRATNVVARGGTDALVVVLALDLTNQTDRISGSVSDGIWLSNLRADRAAFHTATNPAPFAGKYTVLLSGDGQLQSPAGDGYGTVVIAASGYVTCKGILAERAVLTQRAPLSRDGSWPVYCLLHSRGGSILGWASFGDEPTTDVAGQLWWFKPAMPSARYYPGGFTNVTTLVGSRYVPPVGPTNRVLSLTNAFASLSGGNLSQPIINTVILAENNRVTNASTNAFALTIQKATGLFSGRVDDPVSRRRFKFNGALLQKQHVGRGFFLGTNQSGRVYFGP